LVGDALSDSRADVRRAALNLAKQNSEIWQRPKVHKAFLRLLVDPDAQVRKAALDLVGEKGLITLEPGLSGRVKALEVGENDPAVRQQAAEVLRQAGFDPARVQPTGDLSKPALPDFDAFRRTINSYFYKESAKDGRSCANCHATHRIFRLAEPPAHGQPLSDEALQQNYRSLLKVVEVYDPENSLVLRKPRSPSGQGNEDTNSPTGLTHVGGPRWSSTDDPGYQAILQWIRAASAQKVVVSPDRE
jgi:HEAT repeat protein